MHKRFINKAYKIKKPAEITPQAFDNLIDFNVFHSAVALADDFAEGCKLLLISKGALWNDSHAFVCVSQVNHIACFKKLLEHSPLEFGTCALSGKGNFVLCECEREGLCIFALAFEIALRLDKIA